MEYLECQEPDGIVLQVYAVVLLSLTIILLFIATCGLGFMLYRIRSRKYSRQITNSENVEVNNGYVRQQSSEGSEALSLKTMSTLESPFKQSHVMSIVEGDVKEKPRTETEILKPIKQKNSRPVNGAKVPIVSPAQPVITPDQMNKLCEAVLLKMKRNESTSLTHLNELLEYKNGDNNPDKLAPCQFEDDFEEYDVVPKPIKLHNLSDEDDIEVYDCPPRSINLHGTDEQGYYDDMPAEDTYQNASFIQRML